MLSYVSVIYLTRKYIEFDLDILQDQILNETRANIYRRGRMESSIDVPFLGALGTKLPTLTKDLLNSTGER